MLSPHKAQDLVIGKGPSRSRQEENQNRKLLVAQLDLLAIVGDLEAGRIDDQPFDLDPFEGPVASYSRLSLGPSEKRHDPRLDLTRADGLPETVVGTRLQEIDALLGIPVLGDDQNGRLGQAGVGTDKLANLEAGPERKIEFRHDHKPSDFGTGKMLPKDPEGLLPVIGRRHGKSGPESDPFLHFLEPVLP